MRMSIPVFCVIRMRDGQPIGIDVEGFSRALMNANSRVGEPVVVYNDGRLSSNTINYLLNDTPVRLVQEAIAAHGYYEYNGIRMEMRSLVAP